MFQAMCSRDRGKTAGSCEGICQRLWKHATLLKRAQHTQRQAQGAAGAGADWRPAGGDSILLSCPSVCVPTNYYIILPPYEKNAAFQSLSARRRPAAANRLHPHPHAPQPPRSPIITTRATPARTAPPPRSAAARPAAPARGPPPSPACGGGSRRGTRSSRTR